MSKVPNFVDNSYNQLIQAIHGTNDHNPNSSQFDLNLEENLMKWYLNIIFNSNNFTKTQRENLRSFYHLKLKIVAEEFIQTSISECQIINSDDTLQLDKMTEKAFECLSKEEQTQIEILRTCKKVEIFSHSEETIWKTIEYYNAYRKQFTSNRNTKQFEQSLSTGLSSDDTSKKLSSQILAIYKFIDLCNRNSYDRFTSKIIIKKKYLKNLPDPIKRITSSFCYNLLKKNCIHTNMSKSTRKILQHKSIKELLSSEEIAELTSLLVKNFKNRKRFLTR